MNPQSTVPLSSHTHAVSSSRVPTSHDNPSHPFSPSRAESSSNPRSASPLNLPTLSHGTSAPSHTAPSSSRDTPAESSKVHGNTVDSTKTKLTTCTRCGVSVLNMNLHVRSNHQTSTEVMYTGETEPSPVVRNADTQCFHCARCSKGYRDPVSLKSHVKRCTFYAGVPTSSLPDDPQDLDPLPSGDLQRHSSLSHTKIMSPSPYSPTASPKAFTLPEPSSKPPFEESLYFWPPDEHTVVIHPRINLPALGLIVNTKYKIVICISCRHAVSLSTVATHLKKHARAIHSPPGLAESLAQEYGIDDNTPLSFPRDHPPPIFGIEVEEAPFYFCSRCRRGYTAHSRRAYFPVDEKRLQPSTIQNSDHVKLFLSALSPLEDFAKLPLIAPAHDLDLGTFMHRERWIDHVQGFTPDTIADIVRASTPLDGPLHGLRPHTVMYIKGIQQVITKHAAFGIPRKFAQVGDGQTLVSFNRVEPSTVDKYAGWLNRLLVSVIRFARGWTHAYTFPLTEQQKTNAFTLYDALNNGADLFHHIHALTFSLFAHIKTDHHQDKYFSAVNRFLVLASLHPKGHFKQASEITQIIAALVYCNRTTMFYESEQLVASQNMSINDAYETVKIYLTDMQTTPMAYLYNVHVLLKSIRSGEENNPTASFTDDRYRELSYQGDLIHLDGFTRLVQGVVAEYRKIIQDEVFFGLAIPVDFVLDFDISALHDNPRNFAPGFCFLDDPRNGFDKLRNKYACWLLSDPERANAYTYIHNGALIWKPESSYRLLDAFQRAREKLLVVTIVSAGPSARATEIARELLRNISGTELRHLLILYHNLCIVGIQDKTSHQHLRNHFIPHCPNYQVSHELVSNLVLFRPFETMLVTFFKGKESGHRFYLYLWPRYDTQDIVNAVDTMLASYSVPRRSIILALSSRFANTVPSSAHSFDSTGDPHLFERSKEFFFDLMQNHNSTTSFLKYAVDSNSVAHTDPRHILGCIKTSIAWHDIINIANGRRLRVTVDDTERASETHPSTASAPSLPSASSDILRLSNALTWLHDILGRHPPPRPSEALRQRSTIAVHPQRLFDLRKFLDDPTASFRCPEQAELIEKMQARQNHILAILPCGIGKTFMVLFQAKVYDYDKVTVVLLPISGLHADFQRRSNELRVAYAEWTADKPYNPDVSIVFCNKLVHEKRLTRIVFDEAYKILTDSAYREVFSVIKELVESIECPFVFFVRLSSAHSRGSVPQLLLSLVAYLEDCTSRYSSEDRAMVFCRTRSDTEAVAMALGLRPYYAQISEEGKVLNRQIFDDWVSGRDPIIVSTSILGCGIDLPSVRDVVHYQLAYTALDKHQQENRAGRDGRPANAVTFLADNSTSSTTKSTPYDFGADLLLPWAKDLSTCRRITPAFFMDGVADPCTNLGGAQLCDNCLRRVDQPIPRIPSSLPTNPYYVPATLPLHAPLSTSRQSVPRQSGIPSMPPPSITPARSLTLSRTPKTPTLPPRSLPMGIPRLALQPTPSFLNGPRSPSLPRSIQQFSTPSSSHVQSSGAGSARPLSSTGFQIKLTTQQAARGQETYQSLTTTIDRALLILVDFCPPCWVRGMEDWQQHHMDSCPQDVVTAQDDDWRQWRASGIQLPDRYCFRCCIPQRGINGWHPFIQSNTSCPYHNIIKSSIYALAMHATEGNALLSQCDFVPPEAMASMDSFSQWLVERPTDLGIQTYKPFTNLLRLFVWLVGHLNLLS
ncbi:hypothetical protein EW146_g6867 [Bondarzewia mesenterica]|uniref:DNA 3'-5' helicase n=1 Tax=Bondarzewia mesenterica TaxID=1095465 RepID=A0A4S4LMI4_9AGAM|nr:hypothetical protein EW146_g6867 [Bondarzewia mesenterica]